MLGPNVAALFSCASPLGGYCRCAAVRCWLGRSRAVGRVGDVLAEHTSADSSVGRTFTECLRSSLAAAGGLAEQESTLPWQPSLLPQKHSCFLAAENLSEPPPLETASRGAWPRVEMLRESLPIQTTHRVRSSQEVQAAFGSVSQEGARCRKGARTGPGEPLCACPCPRW